VSNAPADKAGRLVAPAEPIRVLGPPARYVGRGGEKLAGALVHFDIDPTGARALDAGASTGGFTDALLQAGAESVVAVDVGRAQLHERLRADPRVDVREQTDIRRVDADAVGGPLDIVVADLSFISLHAVIDALLSLVVPGGDLVVLVKPQFEAGRAEVSKGRGVIRDPAVWRRVLDEVVVAIGEAGGAIMDAMVSPLRGADGNAEFLVHVRPDLDRDPHDGAPHTRALNLDALVAEAAGEAAP
jgi:23S rRNA (cytidine1920-2'-O)/16S rRNA (cytidine1409-2'-O)-methyltransferase